MMNPCLSKDGYSNRTVTYLFDMTVYTAYLDKLSNELCFNEKTLPYIITHELKLL